MSNNELNQVAPPTVKSTIIEHTVGREAIACSSRSVQVDVKKTDAVRKKGSVSRKGAPDKEPGATDRGNEQVRCHVCGAKGEFFAKKKGNTWIKLFDCPKCSKFRPTQKGGMKLDSPRAAKNADLIEASIREENDRVAGEEIARMEIERAERERIADEKTAAKLRKEKAEEAELARILDLINRMNYSKEEALPVEGWWTMWLTNLCLFTIACMSKCWYEMLYVCIVVNCVFIAFDYLNGRVSPSLFLVLCFIGRCRPTMKVVVNVGRKTSLINESVGFLYTTRSPVPIEDAVDQRTDRLAVGIMKHMDPLTTELFLTRRYGPFTFGSDILYVSHEVVAQLLDSDIVVGRSDEEVRRLMETKCRYLYSINIDRFSRYRELDLYGNSIQVAFDLYKDAKTKSERAWGLSRRLLW